MYALAALEPRAAEAVAHASQNQWNADNAPALAGTSRPDVQGLFELEPRCAQAFNYPYFPRF